MLVNIRRKPTTKSLTKIYCKKYNYESKIFTFDENLQSISAISDNPQISLAYKIIYKYFFIV